MARFVAVCEDPATPSIVVQRLMGGESLRDIARAWKIPYTRFMVWIAANGDLTEQCKRARELAGVELRMEGLEIVDSATPETVAIAREQARYRERLARDLNRPLFGNVTHHKHEHTVDLGERLRRARERVIDQVAESVTIGADSCSVVAPEPAPEPVPEI